MNADRALCIYGKLYTMRSSDPNGFKDTFKNTKNRNKKREKKLESPFGKKKKN